MIRGSLIVISVLSGLLSAWIFRRTTNLPALRASRRKLTALLLELRLFSTEPWLVWRAQKSLLRENAHLLLLMLKPALILAIPTACLLFALDSIYGWNPLPIGRPAIVTAQLTRPLTADDANDRLEAPPGIAVETPPVRAIADRQISWRVRPSRESNTQLRLTIGTQTLDKTISAGRRILFSTRKSRSARDVAWITIDYPPSDWLVWFLSISTLTAAGALLFVKR